MGRAKSLGALFILTCHFKGGAVFAADKGALSKVIDLHYLLLILEGLSHLR